MILEGGVEEIEIKIWGPSLGETIISYGRGPREKIVSKISSTPRTLMVIPLPCVFLPQYFWVTRAPHGLAVYKHFLRLPQTSWVSLDVAHLSSLSSILPVNSNTLPDISCISNQGANNSMNICRVHLWPLTSALWANEGFFNTKVDTNFTKQLSCSLCIKILISWSKPLVRLTCYKLDSPNGGC